MYTQEIVTCKEQLPNAKSLIVFFLYRPPNSLLIICLESECTEVD